MTTEIILLCVVAFAAGFIDAVSGGGGLIQTPAVLILLSRYPVANAIATIKIPSFSGTSMAALQYARKVKLDYKRLVVMIVIAFWSAYAGSKLLTMISNQFMKPLLLVVLIVVAVYTYINKNFGAHTQKDHSSIHQWLYSILISMVIGFYDGFIGPGAGSFFILAFISILGYDFLTASANAKFVNLATNLGSMIFFIITKKIIYAITIPMAICNALGGLLGARFAILRGNAFIRIFFLIVVCLAILRFAYDVLFNF